MIKSSIKYAVIMVVAVFIGMLIGYRQGQIDLEYKPSRYDAVVTTLSAITYQDANGKRYLIHDIETTAEYFAEN
jgi:uncharacterized YccA/Bax inhibitor family protein